MERCYGGQTQEQKKISVLLIFHHFFLAADVTLTLLTCSNSCKTSLAIRKVDFIFVPKSSLKVYKKLIVEIEKINRMVTLKLAHSRRET